MMSIPLTDIWDAIDQKLQENKQPYQNLNGLYTIDIIDYPEGSRQLEFHDGQANIHAELKKEAACVLKMKGKHFRQFLEGELNPTKALMTGRLKIEGSIGLALQLEKVLKRYQLSF